MFNSTSTFASTSCSIRASTGLFENGNSVASTSSASQEDSSISTRASSVEIDSTFLNQLRKIRVKGGRAIDLLKRTQIIQALDVVIKSDPVTLPKRHQTLSLWLTWCRKKNICSFPIGSIVAEFLADEIEISHQREILQTLDLFRFATTGLFIGISGVYEPSELIEPELTAFCNYVEESTWSLFDWILLEGQPPATKKRRTTSTKTTQSSTSLLQQVLLISAPAQQKRLQLEQHSSIHPTSSTVPEITATSSRSAFTSIGFNHVSKPSITSSHSSSSLSLLSRGKSVNGKRRMEDREEEGNDENSPPPFQSLPLATTLSSSSASPRSNKKASASSTISSLSRKIPLTFQNIVPAPHLSSSSLSIYAAEAPRLITMEPGFSIGSAEEARCSFSVSS